jgi:hypothetical protein
MMSANNDKENRRQDTAHNGSKWSVNVRPDKVKGGWRVFVKFRCENTQTDQQFLQRSIHCKERQDIGPAIAELLRMADKMGSDSPMADASRNRNYINRRTD